MIYDIFISHASEDKVGVAMPLAEALEAHGLAVWIDIHQLTLGDSLRQKIDVGLGNSRFGLVILSPSFFAKQWTQWELDGLVDREIASGAKVILPVWHEVDHADVHRYSAPLANKLAARTTDGIPTIAGQVLDALSVRATSSAAAPINRVPRTAEEESRLLRERPDGWEYLYFAAVMLRERQRLESMYRDHELGYVPAIGRRISSLEDLHEFVRSALAEPRLITGNLGRLLALESQERAFGPRGQAGDPERIEHLAIRVVETYRGLIEWSQRVRSTSLPDEGRPLIECIAGLAAQAIEQIRAFVAQVVAEMDTLPRRLKEMDSGGEPVTITLELKLTAEDTLEQSDWERHLRRLQTSFD